MSSTRSSRAATAVSPQAADAKENSGSNQKLARLERLVDELVCHAPCEHRIRIYMEEAGLVYVTDPIERMNAVITLLNRMRGRGGGEAVSGKM